MNTRRPVSISNRTQPNANRSVRASVSFLPTVPAPCRGTVPNTIPGVVVGSWVVIVERAAVGLTVAAGFNFASPKSSNFAPFFVSMMLPGLRSRCTIP